MKTVLFDSAVSGYSPKLSTSGHGLWGTRVRDIEITKIVARVVPADNSLELPEFGELKVYFSKRTWKTEKHGLIYTDPLFLRQLHSFLRTLGLPATDRAVDYSEQGMQGDNFVSLDIGKKFINTMRRAGYLSAPIRKAA